MVLDFLQSKLKDIKLFERNVTYYNVTLDRGQHSLLFSKYHIFMKAPGLNVEIAHSMARYVL